MLRYYSFPINHYLLHLVGFSFTYLSKMHDHSNKKFVNVTSELHAKSAELCELTLPTVSDSRKQVPVHFIRDLDQ